MSISELSYFRVNDWHKKTFPNVTFGMFERRIEGS